MTRPAPLPSAGQIAPKMEADSVRWSLGAAGRVPRRAKAPGDGVLLADPGLIRKPDLYLGPCSTMARSASRWAAFKRGRWPGALPSISPSGRPELMTWIDVHAGGRSMIGTIEELSSLVVTVEQLCQEHAR